MKILPLGEAALTFRIGDAATVENAERAASLADAIRRQELDGVTDVVPSVASVSVYFDSDGGDAGRAQRIEAALHAIIARLPEGRSLLPGTRFTAHSVPVEYNGADLDEVAERTGLLRETVIERHSAREYHVLALGFLPGWAYLGPLDPALKLPRRTTPRTRIPAGAVAIAGLQTGVYPRVSPGGWHLLGTTDAVLFDASRERPALFRPGDRVRFVRR